MVNGIGALIPKMRSIIWQKTTASRWMSQSTSIPKKQVRVRDHAYDDYMEIEIKVRKVLKFQDLILSQPSRIISSSGSSTGADRARKSSSPPPDTGCSHPDKETADAVENRLEHIRISRKEFGLPDDFESWVILNHPQFFRLFDADETKNKYIEMVEGECTLGVCEIERVRERECREKGVDAEEIRFSFIVNFPPGFKIGKYYKIAMWKWQRLPYWSPYEDVSGYDLRSLEAQRRMENRVVAMIHELLTLTVEKKMTLERIAQIALA
ncbi:hypothetical protein SASPL_156166 [Salvia splendens]|uniref:PORR domain-containing protein n=1 Tax=Salvia splendens TaxID=180675 RepID=A0A8X8VX78_SALSN|nr:hypothetical protein SASPL_156166 [Salvia splendens]